MRKKSNISWIQFNIHWDKLAKSNCKKCHGRGFEGFEVLPESEEKRLKEEDPNWTPARMLCDCAAKRWTSMDDEERLKYATMKDDAIEIEKAATDQIKQIVAEEAEKQNIELN